MKITNTGSFHEALGRDNEQAEQWLAQVRANRENYPHYDDRWFDHRERELFRAFRDANDWPAAKRVVEATLKDESRAARRTKLEQEAGIPYDEIQ